MALRLAEMTLAQANAYYAQNPQLRYDRPLPASAYDINPAAAQQLWKDPSLTNNRSLLTKLIEVGGKWQEVPTHIHSDKELRLIAYQNVWKTKQRDLLRFIQAGEWYIGSSHHNPGNRKIVKEVFHDEEKGMEMLKFSITHIRNYIGVADGMVATDSPRSYSNQHSAGHVNPKDYPSLLWRVKFLGDITPAEQRAYINNIRTWAMLLQKVTKFPPDYNGNDNLMTNTYAKVIEFGGYVMDAVLGSASALAELHSQAEQVYCSEAGMHLSLNLGLNAPLNKASVTALFGADKWPKVQAMLNEGSDFWLNGKHQDYYGNGTDGYMQNAEQNRLVDMEPAPDWLKPLKDRLPGRPLAGGGLVFRPWDTADMIEHFVKTAIPRQGHETWDVSNAQAELLLWLKPGIFHSMGFSRTNPPPPPLVMLFDTLVVKVRRNYASYEELRAAIVPELQSAHQIVAPKAQGDGAFVPPHMVTTIQGDADELIALEAVGQLFHEDVLRAK
jgi:hypothetical protein